MYSGEPVEGIALDALRRNGRNDIVRAETDRPEARSVTRAQSSRSGIGARGRPRRAVVLEGPRAAECIHPLADQAVGRVLIEVLVSQNAGQRGDLAGRGKGSGGRVAVRRAYRDQISGAVVHKAPDAASRIRDVRQQAGRVIVRLPAEVPAVGDGRQVPLGIVSERRSFAGPIHDPVRRPAAS